MPIYAYRCESCGFGKDVLQKLSDAPLTHCPECGADAFRKQVTAAGFQLKGSGWYVTDFRGGNSKPSNASNEAGKSGEGAASGDSSGKSDGGNTNASSSEGGKSDTPSASSTPAATPAASGGASSS